MSVFKRIQFIKNIVFSKTPYTSLVEASFPEYVLIGEGPHIRIAKGETACIVPWSNIAAAELEYVASPSPSPVAMLRTPDNDRSAGMRIVVAPKKAGKP